MHPPHIAVQGSQETPELVVVAHSGKKGMVQPFCATLCNARYYVQACVTSHCQWGHAHTSPTHFYTGAYPSTHRDDTYVPTQTPILHQHQPMPDTPNHLSTHPPTPGIPKDLLLLPSELWQVHLTWLPPCQLRLLSIPSYTMLVLLGKGLKGVRRDTLCRTAHYQSSCWQGVHTLQHTTNKLDEGQWSVVWRLGDIAHTPPPALVLTWRSSLGGIPPLLCWFHSICAGTLSELHGNTVTCGAHRHKHTRCCTGSVLCCRYRANWLWADTWQNQ